MTASLGVEGHVFVKALERRMHYNGQNNVFTVRYTIDPSPLAHSKDLVRFYFWSPNFKVMAIKCAKRNFKHFAL